MSIPLNRLIPADLDELRSVVSRVLDSGWFTLGQELESFQEEFSDFLCLPGAVGVGSGLDALTIALACLNVGAGSRVGIAANAGGYATHACLRLGAEPILLDVELASAHPPLEEVARSIELGATAIIWTHLFGNVSDLGPVLEVCRSNGVVLIEDCAQALGPREGELGAGSWGDACAFSFYPTKNLGGIGDGGAVVFRDPQLLGHAERMRNYGWAERYQVVEEICLNSRLDEVQAAVLRSRLPLVNQMVSRRRAIAARYGSAMGSDSLRILTNYRHAATVHLFVMRVMNRPRAIEVLEERGIAWGIHYPILDQHQPAWRDRSWARQATTPNAERLSQEILTIPCFSEMTEDEIVRVEQALGVIQGLN